MSWLRQNSRLLLGFGVSVITVAGCVWWALRQDAPSFPSSATGVGLLVLATAVYGIVTVVRGLRWHVILRHAGIDHGRGDALRLTVVGYMGNTVLPARGGEVLRVLLMSERCTARKRELVGSIIPERLLDAVALAIVFATLTLVISDAPTGIAPALGAIAAAVLALAAMYAYLVLRRRGRFQAFADRVRAVTTASRALLTSAGAALGATSISIWLLEGVVFWLTARALHAGLSIGEAALVVALASLATLIPAAPGYVGTFDAAILFALRPMGVRGGDALALVLLYRFVIFVPITIAGVGFVLTRYGGVDHLRELRRKRSRVVAPSGA
jgi:glycosyltransferase 2 family protein